MKTNFTKKTDRFVLPNATEIPCIGFGTFLIEEGRTTVNAVRTALNAGYRHIDAAAVYHNEPDVGIGIKSAGIARKDIFLTSKVWNDMRGYENTLKAFEKSCRDLQTDYLDLYLIHWPANEDEYPDGEWKRVNAATWKALERLYKEGKVKAIGVINFLSHHLEALMETAEIMPMVNQIEFHPGMMQKETLEFCRANGITVEAWSPLGCGSAVKNPLIQKLAIKYGKSPAQLCLRWVLQNQVLPLSKSVTESRIYDNIKIFNFKLTETDMEQINHMPYIGGSGLNPDHFKG